MRVRDPPWTRAGGGIGRHTSLRTRRPLHGSSSLPRPTSYTPVAELVDAARSKRASTCRFDSCREYHAPEPDGDGSSLQNCDSRFNSSRVCHVGDAEVVEAAVRKTALTGFESRLSLHCSPKRETEGAKRRQRFLVPKTSAPEKTRMGVRLLRPPPSHKKAIVFFD